MLSRANSENALSLALALAAAAWGLYWIPLRTIEGLGIASSWSIVFFNACPLIVLLPMMVLSFRKLAGIAAPTLFAALMTGSAFTLYSNALVETTIIRATMLYYLTPVWTTILGVVWLDERLTTARIISIAIAFVGLFLLLSGNTGQNHPINVGDLYGLLSGMFWAVAVAALNRWSKIPIIPLATFIFLSTSVFSTVFAGVLNSAPMPDIAALRAAFPTAAFWSIIILLPSFCVIFRVSQILFPGRVGILLMSEVVVAIVSASLLVPDEKMMFAQWVGAAAILVAGLVEVSFGYRRVRCS